MNCVAVQYIAQDSSSSVPMLTDIFAVRYESRPIWTSYGLTEQRLLIQAFGVVSDVMPTYSHKSTSYQPAWETPHDLLARELGVKHLSSPHWNDGNGGWQSHKIHAICENFVTSKPQSNDDIDEFIKHRLSFVEVALRKRGDEFAKERFGIKFSAAPQAMKSNVDFLAKFEPSGFWESSYAAATNRVKTWKAAIHELNVRFKQADVPLSYNDGFIQLVDDALIENHVEAPFWKLVSDAKWKNVSMDMAEAIDLRDSGAKDPAYHAAKALESVIKIISDDKRWSSSTENGAANYIDNLVSQKNGRFIEVWESDFLKEYFKRVRNPMGHGAGSSEMPILTKQQCDWAIHTAMSWTLSLIDRL